MEEVCSLGTNAVCWAMVAVVESSAASVFPHSMGVKGCSPIPAGWVYIRRLRRSLSPQDVGGAQEVGHPEVGHPEVSAMSLGFGLVGQAAAAGNW